jgi:hypothetical protein
MIRVQPKAENTDFDERVRQPGLTFLNSAGIEPGEEAPENFNWNDYWTRAIEDLYDDYEKSVPILPFGWSMRPVV